MKKKKRKKARQVDRPTPQPRTWVRRLRLRLFQGVLAVGPIAVTFWIFFWLYNTLRHVVIDPVAKVVLYLWGQPLADGETLPPFIATYIAPAMAVAIVLSFLYVMGSLFQSQIHKTIDWLLLKAPIVNTIYSAVQKVFESIGRQTDTPQFQRVVLVAFPHPGMRVPGFVTSTCRDAQTGKTILCVYVPTTPVPSSGYMLLIPEEEVTELDWDLNETLQAIVSGGISVPPQVNYFAPPAPPKPGT